MRGFVITIDGIIGLIVFLSLFIVVSSPAMKVTQSAWESAHMRKISMDSLAVLEKSGVLSRAVEANSSSELIYFMSTEFSSVCTQITVEGEEYMLSVVKPGCEKIQGGFVVARRSFVENGRYYIAEMKVWNR
ncbi:MAG: hypothetical protein QXF56_00200 [Candidatus Micrarchaeia archaeon]